MLLNLIDKETKDILEQKIPDDVIHERPAGGRSLSYVSGNFVIDQLNKAFNYNWNWIINEHWIEESIPKKTKEGKEIPQGPVAHVIGTLEIYLADEKGNVHIIRKMASGSKSIIGGQSEQESIFKSAGTDALKKAASLIGIAAQLYRDGTEQKYFERSKLKESWPAEVFKKYSKEFVFIEDCKERFDLGDNEIDDIVSDWSDNKISSFYEMDPNKIKDFVAYMKDRMPE